ncbi:putative protein family (UPF0104) [Gaiella occulta]|uniref:Uncharacterized protein n=2 Tax=Gaiella occulta TaxID=1002870 RepID=A0A7M2YZF5_9ACTN|nr:putative protein family (UPF0104) [Gaiella occulta]
MRSHYSTRHMVTAGLSLAVLAGLCASPSLLGGRVGSAIAGLGAASPAWLWAAGLAFAGTSVCGALAWRAALRAAGTPLGIADAGARYGIGCGLNAVAPAHIGSAVRIALFGRVSAGGCWTVGGAAAAVGVTRIVWLGALVAIGSAAGVLPAWPLFAAGAVVVAAAAAACTARRVALPRRLDQILVAFRALASSPRDLAVVAAWALLGAATKVAAAAAIVAALGIDHPLRAALILVPAVELAAVMPLTPGNVGVASAAVALALGAQGIGSGTALSVGIAFAAVELLTAVAVGLAGGLLLSGRLCRPYVRLAAAGAASLGLAAAFGATVLPPVV